MLVASFKSPLTPSPLSLYFMKFEIYSTVEHKGRGLGLLEPASDLAGLLAGLYCD